MPMSGEFPVISVAQMREVDRIMIEDLGIGLPQMMENAGRALAARARAMLGGNIEGRRITILAGSGGNGGGGLAAARRLTVWGGEVSVVLGQARARLTGVPAQQLAILTLMGVPVAEPVGELAAADLIIDALIGYSLRGAPRGPIAVLIAAAILSRAPVLALDIPSGLDGDAGTPYEPCVAADSTLTLALPKAGLLTQAAAPWVGQLFLADISVPPLVYERLGIDVGPLFAMDDIVAVR